MASVVKSAIVLPTNEHGLVITENCFALELEPGFHPFNGTLDTVCVKQGDKTLLGDNAKILIEPNILCWKTGERGPKLFGVAGGFCASVKRCMCSAHNALCNRHGVKQPQATSDFGPFYKFLDDIRDDVIVEYEKQTYHWYHNWIGKWPTGKVVAILRDLVNAKYAPNRVTSHVKFELYSKMPTKARLIQAYSNFVAQAYAGPECTALQKAYAKVLYMKVSGKHDISVTFASGMNPQSLGHWMQDVYCRRGKVWFYERDGKSWDATMQRLHHRLKMHAYSFAEPIFKEVIESGFKVIGDVSFRGGGPHSFMRYELTGTTKSGHNDTTLGNSIVNAGIAYEAMVACGLSGDIIVAGDDLLIAITSDFDVERLAESERSFGIMPEYRKFSSYKSTSFISGFWMRKDYEGGFMFLPKPGRQIAKLFWSVNHPSPNKVDDYLHSIVTGLKPTIGELPVMGAFLASHDRVGKIIDIGRKFYIFRDAPKVEFDARVVMEDFCERYNTNETEIKSLESILYQLAGNSGILRNDLFQRMMEVDTCDIECRADLM